MADKGCLALRLGSVRFQTQRFVSPRLIQTIWRFGMGNFISPEEESKMNPKLMRTSKAIQKGFTLVEMVIVVAVIGVLIALVAPAMSGSRDGATARLLTSVAQQTANSFSAFSSAAGLTPDVSGTYLTGAASIADFPFKGRSFVNSSYQRFYDQAGILPISAAVTDSTCGGQNYKVGNFCTTIAVSASSMTVTYGGLTPNLTERLAQAVNPSTSFTKTSAGFGISTELTINGSAGGPYSATFTKTFNQ